MKTCATHKDMGNIYQGIMVMCIKDNGDMTIHYQVSSFEILADIFMRLKGSSDTER